MVEGLLEAFRFHDIGVLFAAMRERSDSLFNALWIDVDDEIEAEFFGHLIAEGNHFLELPCGVDMEEGEGGLSWVERLHGEVQHDSGVLADGIEHDRSVELGGNFTDDMNALGLKLLEVRQIVILHEGVYVKEETDDSSIRVGKVPILT